MISDELKKVIIEALKLDDFDFKDETVASLVPGMGFTKSHKCYPCGRKTFQYTF